MFFLALNTTSQQTQTFSQSRRTPRSVLFQTQNRTRPGRNGRVVHRVCSVHEVDVCFCFIRLCGTSIVAKNSKKILSTPSYCRVDFKINKKKKNNRIKPINRLLSLFFFLNLYASFCSLKQKKNIFNRNNRRLTFVLPRSQLSAKIKFYYRKSVKCRTGKVQNIVTIYIYIYIE